MTKWIILITLTIIIILSFILLRKRRKKLGKDKTDKNPERNYPLY